MCSETAFSELVGRHLDFVYSAALRMVRDPHLAEDVTQRAFVALAKNAAELSDRPVLAGWLHRTAQNIAAQTVRTIERRRAREQEVFAMNELLSASADGTWEHIAPHLDEAMSELGELDRDAVLLRYFKNHDLRTVGTLLGISDDAAQKRVSRAVQRLREYFAKRGIQVGVAGLAGVLSANAVQAAPAGLVAAIATAALAGTAAHAPTLIAATTQTLAMTTIQKALVTATVAVLAGVGIYEARQTVVLKGQVETLQQQAPLAAQVEKMRGERDAATNRLTELTEALASAKRNQQELFKLRGEVALLRQQTNRLAQSVQTLSATLSAANSPGAPMEQTNFPRESWTFAGLATPENALQSYMWAKNRGDVAAAFATATPELTQEIREFYFKDKSDEEISALLVDSAKNQTGIQILKKLVAADDQVIFQVHVDGEAEKSYSLLTMKKLGDEWKVSSVEERAEEKSAPRK